MVLRVHLIECVCRFKSPVQVSKLQDLVNRSKLARCRGRFVCPVILYNGKVPFKNILFSRTKGFIPAELVLVYCGTPRSGLCFHCESGVYVLVLSI